MKSSLKPHHLANEIRLKRTQHNGSFVLVEGSDDSRFYKRFIENQQCHVVVAHGKKNVIDAVGLLDSENFAGVMGIVDSDFDLLNGIPLPSSHLVAGRNHDLEVTLIRSPALDAVLYELASSEKLSGFEQKCGVTFRGWLLETASCLGYLRWHCRQPCFEPRLRIPGQDGQGSGMIPVSIPK